MSGKTARKHNSKRNPHGQPEWKIIGQLGDVNPLAYGGGILAKHAQGHYVLEYLRDSANMQDQDDVDELDLTYTVYSTHFDGDEDLTVTLDWANLAEVASSVGATVKELRAMAKGSPQDKALFIETVAGHYGWENIDSYPNTFTGHELATQWEL